ncbi:MAG: DUF6797 domain-containing protein [Planctomycetota bacterium]
MCKHALSVLVLLICYANTSKAQTPDNLRDENLVAWCIVPFDSEDRRPAERAEMVRRLGLRRVAYDWRQKHVATFEEEILQYKRNGIEYFAFWDVHDQALQLFKKYGLRPQIWKTLPSPKAETQQDRVRLAAKQLLPLVETTRELGSKLGLYNHGGWGGEPENMIAVCEYLRKEHDAEHIGIVYNLHHGHGHIDDFETSLKRIKPYLLCLNLNGMTRDGDKRGKKILPLGEGEFDVKLLKMINQSGYEGPVGIIGHTQDDVEQRLQDNLDGLHWMLPQLDGKPAGPKPKLRTYSPEKTEPLARLTPRTLLPSSKAVREPPITVECRATLPDANGYNILVASDAKRSGEHWELFSMNGSGTLTAYLPGCRPDHVTSRFNVCDGRPHVFAMIYEANRIRLFVDGKSVADQKVDSLGHTPVPGKLAIGGLVEGSIGCRGSVDWVRISKGVQEIGTNLEAPIREASTVVLWNRDDQSISSAFRTPEYSTEAVASLVAVAQREGDAHRGLARFADAKTACLGCHRVGEHGGTVGPELTTIGRQRTPSELVESLLWPRRSVKPEYQVQHVLDIDGGVHQGYVVREDAANLVLRDPSTNKEISLAIDDIESRREGGTLMPENLVGTMTAEEVGDLVRFMTSLGTESGVPSETMNALLEHASTHAHGPADFAYDRKPLQPERWPNWEHHVNRDRVYDFYAKQADYFRSQTIRPLLITEYPGLDGGDLGHWGNQNDTVWADDRWNRTRLGSVLGGVFRNRGKKVPRGVCVRLGENGKWAACFNPETLGYEAVWRGGFVSFSSQRHGFLAGLSPVGEFVNQPTDPPPKKPFRYRGYYRIGKDVAFSYEIDEIPWLDWPTIENGRFKRIVKPAQEHPMYTKINSAPAQWPEILTTKIRLGDSKPYAVDRIELPFENPWNALLFCGGHGFLPDGSALVCTMQGDVWRVSEFRHPSRNATWRRFASGLHHPLGMVIDEEGIFVLCRDQITRLHDLNHDGEADFYECFSNAFVTSPAGHDYICGLERDVEGNFYTASGNQGLVRISNDGERAEVLATGFRNPDGIGLTAGGMVTVPCSEGGWTPASMICAIEPSGDSKTIPHFGYGGPRNGDIPSLPLAYLPRGLDNSSGGQVFVSSDRWGPLEGKQIHLSFGTGTHFLLLSEKVDGQLQGAVVPLPGEFRSGVHRGRFHPVDGQLYVTGMQGWGSYTPDDGCFERVRYTGDRVQLPTGFHVHENGIAISFAEPLDVETAGTSRAHFAQVWNYRYSSAYGSPEFSTRQIGVRGHDVVQIESAHVLEDGKTLFLELPELQPVNQLHLRLQSAPDELHDLFVTVHKLAPPFEALPGMRRTKKTIRPHPILADMNMATNSVPNPHRKKIKNARSVRLETATNLSYADRLVRVKAGEPIALTLANVDVVPHNWALIRPGTMERVGELADRAISDPDAVLRHYVPETEDVLAYTDVVSPRDEFTIYFKAPAQSGNYPYVCTFPGHWKIMNGIMVVEGTASN